MNYTNLIYHITLTTIFASALLVSTNAFLKIVELYYKLMISIHYNRVKPDEKLVQSIGFWTICGCINWIVYYLIINAPK